MGNQTVRKYIIIPEFAPLYAMAKCYGPTQAPLKAPTLTPVDVIGELLKQTGKQKVTIYEVVKDGKKFSRPVQLTSLNYRLPYEEICRQNGVIPPAETVEIVPSAPATKTVTAPEPKEETEAPMEAEAETDTSVAADTTAPVEKATVSSDEAEPADSDNAADVVVEDDTTSVPSEDPTEEDPFDSLVETVRETFGDDAVIEDVPVQEESVTPVKKDENPYAGMTKAQRKAAKRRAAEERAAEAAAAEEILHLMDEE